MCGIIGIVAEQGFNIRDELLSMLSCLEYRGYDSSGFASSDGTVCKEVGYISNLRSKVKSSMESKAAISHTRWATHGGVNQANSHPHMNPSKDIFVVHNGIIENYRELAARIGARNFVSTTDTEIIPHYISSFLDKGYDMLEAMSRFMQEAEGTYAVLILRKGEDRIYAMKKDSPLLLGRGKGGYCFASDTNAFDCHISHLVMLDDNEICIADSSSARFYDLSGNSKEKAWSSFKSQKPEISRCGHGHYMIKEIMEQPGLASSLLDSLKSNPDILTIASDIRSSRHVVMIGCGTSYHAALIAESAFREAGIDAHAVIASEFLPLMVRPDSVVIAVSQSGETMDVLMALKSITVPVYSLVNSVHSTLVRQSLLSINISAGPEIAVASTKAFTNQVIVFLYLAKLLGLEIDLDSLPGLMQEVIGSIQGNVQAISSGLSMSRSLFILGRNASYAAALEIALKLKEVCYIHAEAARSGELKHGTIALIEEGTPVIALNADKTTENASHEVSARGAEVIPVSSHGELALRTDNPHLFALCASVIGHLLSYHIGCEKGVAIDKPRNLAKSVTVL